MNTLPSDPWRTATVLALCEAMRAARDYSACPILADALEEADFPANGFLTAFRAQATPLVWLEHHVAVVYSAETAAAADRIAALAGRMGAPDYPTSTYDPGFAVAMTYELLMAAAGKFADTGDDGLGSGSMDWSNLALDPADPSLPDDAVRPPWGTGTADTVEDRFWKDWALVTGRSIPPNADEAIFRCSC